MTYIVADVVLTFFAVVSTIISLTILFYLLSAERKAPHIRPYFSKDSKKTSPDEYVLVSIIIAARNEEEKIADCISSLLAQTYENFELIVTDDNSTDKTLAIAREFEARDSRIHVIQAGAKPDGWVGKSWPCYKGFQSSKGEVILFVDADSAFDSHALEYCINYFERASLDMYSISPLVVLQRIWSKATLPLVSAGINLLYPIQKVNDKASKRAYVFGTFILVRRSVYVSIGGHEAVRERIVEDAALAQLAKSKGYKLQLMIGDGLATTDWESDFKSVYNGMERVFSDSIRSYGLVSLLDAALIFFLGLYPILFILGFVFYSVFFHNIFLANNLNFFVLNAGLAASIIGVLCSLSISANELNLVLGERRRIGFAPLLFPLGYLLFLSAIITSTFKVSSKKGLEWKGQKFNQELVISSGKS